MLAKRDEESLDDLLRRLDAAFVQDHDDGVLIDEVNTRGRGR